MKKHKILKNISLIFLIFSILLTFLGCEYNILPDAETKATDVDTKYIKATTIDLEELYGNVKDYQIIKTEKGYRLVFDDSYAYEEYGSNPGYEGFDIESLGEFHQRLIDGKLTFNEKNHIYHSCHKDDYGYIILNPYISSFKFSHPEADRVECVNYYNGSTQSARVIFEQYPIVRLNVTVPTDEYTQRIDSWFLRIEQQKKSIEYEKELSNGKNLVCYNKTITDYESMYTEEYILSDGVKKVLISKVYYFSDIPLTIELFAITENNLYLNAGFLEGTNYTEIVPSDEFLFGFDVEAVERT